MRNKVVFEKLGLKVHASKLTGWITAEGNGVEYGWGMDSFDAVAECPAFIRKALGLRTLLPAINTELDRVFEEVRANASLSKVRG